MIYGSFGRQADEAILEGYAVALEDRTDYQLAIATDVELKTSGDWPITAAELRRLSGNYPKSAEEDRFIEQQRHERLQLESNYQKPEPKTVREAMRRKCRQMIAEGRDPDDFCADLLKRLEKDTSDNPAALINSGFSKPQTNT